MSPHLARRLIEWLWIAFLIYWYVAAISVKSIARREGRGARTLQIVLSCVAVVIMVDGRLSLGALNRPFWPLRPAGEVAAVALVVAGLAFAIWARLHLAGNWSSTIAVKANHELISSGPYARVRHPIYTGMWVALAGAALALGFWRDLLALALFVLGFWAKASAEDRLMAVEFGASFSAHARRAGMFFPRLRAVPPSSSR